MMDGYEVFKTTKKVTDNIAYLVPRNTNIDQPGRSGREGGSGANSAQQEDEDIDWLLRRSVGHEEEDGVESDCLKNVNFSST